MVGLLASAVLAVAGHADSARPPEPLHPYERASASGEWVLQVDPSERYGAGAARCHLTRAGEIAWERELPFTFRDVVLADDGTVAGIASTNGIGLGQFEGELVVAILAPDGTLRSSERVPYELSAPHRMIYPRAEGLHLAGEADRVALHVTGRKRGVDEWWIYSLSTGAAVGREFVRPAFLPSGKPSKSEPAPFLLPLESVAVLELAPLGEVRFAMPDATGERRRPRFDLVDSLGRVVFLDDERSEVLVFDRGGELRLAVRPAEEDIHWAFDLPVPEWVAARPDGGVLVRVKKGLLGFAADGTRLGRTGADDWLAPRQCYWPSSEGCWEIGDDVRRLDSGGRGVRTIERGAHERWFRSLNQPVVARDGSLAVLDSSSQASDRWLHFFDVRGEALASVELPAGYSRLAYDGRRAVVEKEDVLVFVGRDGALVGRAMVPEPLVPDAMAFSPEGELWLFAGLVMQRFAVQ